MVLIEVRLTADGNDDDNLLWGNGVIASQLLDLRCSCFRR
jgi:hypothetical protein